MRGLVRDVLEVDRDAERAVEAVLAERAEAVVVESARGAVEALAWLREARAGRGVLVALPEPERRGARASSRWESRCWRACGRGRATRRSRAGCSAA